LTFFKNTSSYPIQDEEEFFDKQHNSLRCRSMHIKHNEKKYHIQFLKDYDAQNSSYHHPRNNRHLLLTERIIPTNIESLFSPENSTMQEPLSETTISNTYHESKKFNQI